MIWFCAVWASWDILTQRAGVGVFWNLCCVKLFYPPNYQIWAKVDDFLFVCGWTLYDLVLLGLLCFGMFKIICVLPHLFFSRTFCHLLVSVPVLPLEKLSDSLDWHKWGSMVSQVNTIGQGGQVAIGQGAWWPMARRSIWWRRWQGD